jgi:hypothetical protein
MNELIKELADSLWRVHPADIDAMGLKTRTEFYEHELKKFSELLIREAAAFVSSAAEVYNQAEQDACVRASKGLMKHFGVEE